MNANALDLVVNEIAATLDVPAGSIRPESTLAEIGMDSLQALQLVVALEQATQVQFDEEDLKKFTTVQSIVDLLAERSKRAAA
jgi:acyl carrier protein